MVASASAQAELFNYSYTFNSNTVVTGSFDGTAAGNLVTNLSNVSANLNGIALIGSGSLYANSRSNSGSWQTGGAVASFNGLQNNFIFLDTNYPTSATFQNFFASVTYPLNSQAVTAIEVNHSNLQRGGNNAPISWSLVASVPEPETYAMLLAGLGLMGAVLRRRKSKEA